MQLVYYGSQLWCETYCKDYSTNYFIVKFKRLGVGGFSKNGQKNKTNWYG